MMSGLKKITGRTEQRVGNTNCIPFRLHVALCDPAMGTGP